MCSFGIGDIKHTHALDAFHSIVQNFLFIPKSHYFILKKTEKYYWHICQQIIKMNPVINFKIKSEKIIHEIDIGKI